MTHSLQGGTSAGVIVIQRGMRNRLTGSLGPTGGLSCQRLPIENAYTAASSFVSSCTGEPEHGTDL